MLIDNFVSFIFGVILTFIGQQMISGNKEFFRIISDFRKKLPPKYKKAKSGYNEELCFYHMDLNTLKTNIETRDIDNFLKELEDFDYKSLKFKRKQIEKYSKNIQRLIKTTDWELFSIGILQEILENENEENLKPYLFGSKIAKYIKC